MLVFFWIVFAIAVGVWASNKGRSGFGWFLLSLIISPLLGFIFCAVVKDLSATAKSATPSSDTHVRCPACAEYVLPEASVCKHCGKALTPQPTYATERAQARDSAESAKTLVSVGVLVVLGIVLYLAIQAR